MRFPQWPPTSSLTPSGGWEARLPCDAHCIFVGIDIVTATADSGRRPCILQRADQHKVIYRNIGGVSVSVTFSANACPGLIFVETGTPHWSETVTAKQRTDLRNAKRIKLERTVDSSGHSGGPGKIEFEFAIHDPGLRAQPPAVHLHFTI
jgi:hypothetical protein